MKGKKLTKLVAAFLTGTLLFAFAGCGQKGTTQPAAKNEGTAPAATVAPTQAASASKVDAIKKAGKIVVGTSADYAPYEFHKMINGKDEIIGFDIAIAKEIAKDLGVELKIQDMKFDGLLAALDTGSIDFVVAGMTPTEERKKNVDFTNIYYQAQQGVMVRAEDKDKLKKIEDVKGKKVGVQKGSIQEGIAKEQMKDSSLVALGKIPELILELKNKKVDALIVELPVASGYVSKNKDLVVSEIKVKDEDGGSAVAVKKGNADLITAMNKTLDRLMKDKQIDKFVVEANEAVEN